MISYPLIGSSEWRAAAPAVTLRAARIAAEERAAIWAWRTKARFLVIATDLGLDVRAD
ncbi:hypothetical protein LUPAC06_03304 [Micromonospora saelicesensis]|uniref:hypothetical protein n=1 Tax=Micromonospora saelicesensis TaxID=285676 RepID=UPI000DC02CE0|nr:hypothetical protein [Micromonospora saelicesensis]RAO57116.1 hypothetical protein LUPAC06_03304 [Micromonospora saelicesensis]